MAIAADRNFGFEGTVSTAEWAVMSTKGARFAVVGPDDMAVTQGNGDRGVAVSAGSAWGDGVLSEWDTGANLNGSQVAAGARWDTVAIRRDWLEATTELVLLEGGSDRAISSNRANDPGATVSDQPIALVRFDAGSTVVAAIVDLRTWVGDGGGVIAASPEVRQFYNGRGTHLTIGDRTWVRTRDSSGAAVWESLEAPQRVELYGAGGSIPGQPSLNLANIDGALIQAGSWSGTLGAWGQGRVTFPRPFPNGQLMCMAQWAGPGGHVQDRIVTVLPPGYNSDRASFVFRVADASAPSQVANAFARINWIAIGW